MLELDCAYVEGIFGDSDVEAHGMKGAIAIAVSSAAILAPAGQAGAVSSGAQSRCQHRAARQRRSDYPGRTWPEECRR